MRGCVLLIRCSCDVHKCIVFVISAYDSKTRIYNNNTSIPWRGAQKENEELMKSIDPNAVVSMSAEKTEGLEAVLVCGSGQDTGRE